MIEATVLQTMCIALDLELHRVYDFAKPMYYTITKPYTNKVVWSGDYTSCKSYLKAKLNGKEL